MSIRYPRDYRSDPQAIATEVLIPIAGGGTVPLGQVANVSLAQGPSSIRTENAQLAAYIFVDLRDRDLGGYVADAQKAVAIQVKFPPGYYVTWSGQFEYLERAKARLQVVVPVTVLIIFLLLYLNFRRVTETLIVMLSELLRGSKTRGNVPICSLFSRTQPNPAMLLRPRKVATRCNMTGPSLAELWNRRSGLLASFPRYSPALKSAGIIWNDDTLDEWIKDPQHFIPGGGMMMGGGAVPNLKKLDPEDRVRSINRCGDTYKVVTADGKIRDFWERNLRFKTDVSDDGPQKGTPAIVPAGMMGDRADVIFASPDEINGFISHQC